MGDKVEVQVLAFRRHLDLVRTGGHALNTEYKARLWCVPLPTLASRPLPYGSLPA